MDSRIVMIKATVIIIAGLSAMCCSGAGVRNNDSSDLTGSSSGSANSFSNPPKIRSLINQDEPLQTDDHINSSQKKEPKIPQHNASSKCIMNAQLPNTVFESMDVQTLHEIGKKNIMTKNAQSALSILLLASKKSPKDAQIMGNLATAMLQCKLFDEALKHITKAVALDPDNVILTANLAQTYQIIGRIPDAISTYHKAIALDPKDPELHNNLAVLLIVIQNLKSAEEEARKASGLDPKSVIYLINLGYILIRQKKYIDAEMVINRAIDQQPDNADAHNQLGVAYAAQGRNTRAIEQFKIAIKLNPNHSTALENIKALDHNFDFYGPWNKKKFVE